MTSGPDRDQEECLEALKHTGVVLIYIIYCQEFKITNKITCFWWHLSSLSVLTYSCIIFQRETAVWFWNIKTILALLHNLHELSDPMNAEWHDGGVSAPCPSLPVRLSTAQITKEKREGVGGQGGRGEGGGGGGNKCNSQGLVAGFTECRHEDPYRCPSACPCIHQHVNHAENKHTIP